MTQAKALSGRQADKIHALTSLRFFAALVVVFYHTLPLSVPALARLSLIHAILTIGYVPVSFFFLLSGYILGIVYLSSGRSVPKRKFYAARFARIYPLYFVTLLADTPDMLLYLREHYSWATSIGKTVRPLLIHVVMMQAWILGLRRIDGPSWSLSVEALFYLIFPFIGLWLWRLKGARLWIVAIAIAFGGQTLVYFATTHFTDYAVRDNPVLHVSTFVLGIMLARWQYLQREKWGRSPAKPWSIAVALLLAVLGFAAVVYWQAKIPDGNLRDGILAPVFMCLIWAFSAGGSLPARVLSAKSLVVLGESSYGLYLIHMPVYHVLEWMHLRAVAAMYPVYLGGSIALSVLSFYFLEIPSRKWILRKLQTRPKETMEVASDAQ